MTKLNGNIWFQPVLYRKPVDMELWVAEANIDDLPFEIEDEGEAMLEKAEPLELFLAKFERQFEVSEDEAGAVLREILDGIQYFVCQKQTVGKQGLVIDRSPSGHAA
jgi:hypothetical protein